MKFYLPKLLNAETLTAEEAEKLMLQIIGGEAEAEQIAAVLASLATRGETADEITGFVRAVRQNMIPVAAPDGALDVCGTGGDGLNTFNVSTTVSLLLAACGVPMAKHGNRAVSSKSGSADVLEELGIELESNPMAAEQALEKSSFAFLFAPAFHPAFKTVKDVRAKLGVRTVFNILGPLCNPAQVKLQLLGISDERYLYPMAEVLNNLGHKRALVVCGTDRMDEISLHGETHGVMLKDGHLEQITIKPEDAGINRADLSEIAGGNAAENAATIRNIFNGENGAKRDIVVLNTAAALMVAGKVSELKAGAEMAAEVIASGAALAKLEELQK